MASSKIGKKALAWEITQIGTTEKPPGSNRGPKIDAWNLGCGAPVGTPWCMAFQHAAFKKQGVTLGGWAGVQSFLNWAKAHGYEVSGPAAGDIVCFDWNADNWYDHVGIVEKRIGGTFPGGRFAGWLDTVEGNTGNGVYRRRRFVRNARFCRVHA